MLTVLLLLPLVLSDGVRRAQPNAEVPHLYGIAALQVKKDAIEVTRDETLPSGLDLRKGGERLERATITVGESFEITDGHHLGHAFTLLAIEGDAARLQTTFWTSFPGQKPTESKSTQWVRSYVVKQKKQ